MGIILAFLKKKKKQLLDFNSSMVHPVEIQNPLASRTYFGLFNVSVDPLTG